MYGIVYDFHEVSTNHCDENREPPEDDEHGQTETLGAPQSKHHVAQVEHRQRPDLVEGVGGQLGELNHSQAFQ